MPKERRDRSVSHDRYRVSPFPCSSVDMRQHSPTMSLETKEVAKEWEEARCPVCMEHPHNAVLLICSSHEKGCRPYMCNTSHRHSNCLDQFRKQFTEISSSMAMEEDHQLSTTDSFLSDNSELTTIPGGRSEEMPITTNPVSCDNQVQLKIVCPLCRGKIISWIVDEPARCFMNAKIRSCSTETCHFRGVYTDLRKHARKEHPHVCPSEVDPERQRDWRRLERQRDLGDLLSTLNSSFVEDGDDDNILPVDGGWLSVFFLIRVFQPETNVRISRWSGNSRSRGQLNSRRRSNRLRSENHDLETRSSSRDNGGESPGDNFDPWGRSDHIPEQTMPDNTP